MYELKHSFKIFIINWIKYIFWNEPQEISCFILKGLTEVDGRHLLITEQTTQSCSARIHTRAQTHQSQVTVWITWSDGSIQLSEAVLNKREVFTTDGDSFVRGLIHLSVFPSSDCIIFVLLSFFVFKFTSLCCYPEMLRNPTASMSSRFLMYIFC